MLMSMEGKLLGLLIDIYNHCTEKLTRLEMVVEKLKEKLGVVARVVHDRDQKLRSQKSEISDLHAMLGSY